MMCGKGNQNILINKINKSMEYLSKMVYPIYFKIDSGADAEKYESNGSGIVIKFNGSLYFVTAAHCLYENNNDISNKCFIPCGRSDDQRYTGLIPIECFERIYIGNWDTKDDDIAIFKIANSDAEECFDYFEVCYSQNLSMCDMEDTERYYGVALGFPANKNQGKDVYRKRGQYLLSHGTVWKLDKTILEELGIVADKNLVLDKGKYTDTEHGTSGNFHEPKGMSGGALFTFSQQDLRDESPSPRLSGLLIEHHKLRGKNQYFVAICIKEIILRISRDGAR